MTRGSQNKERGAPERTCLVSRETGPKSGLIRFVVGPEDQIVPDIAGKLPGRGLYVAANRTLLGKAVKKNLFSRAAKRPVKVPETLVADVEAQLAARVASLIGLARKAGRAVAGFEKVKNWLINEDAQVLVQASDGSGRGKNKLSSPPGKGAFIGVLTATELGLAFGREHVIHAALAPGGLTKSIVEDAARLSGLREDLGGTSTGKGTKNI